MQPPEPAPLRLNAAAGRVLRIADADSRFGRSAVASALRVGRWQQPHPRVVVLHNGPLSRAEFCVVAVAAAAPGAAVAGPTALEVWGLPGFGEETVHVALRQGQRRPTLAGARYLLSSRLESEDVHGVRRPPITRPARSVLDTASLAKSPRWARAVVLAAVQRRLVTPRALDEALDRRGPCRHHGHLVETIVDARGGVQSLPEQDFDRIVRFRGLPSPERQQRVRGRDGHYYLDAGWDRFRVGAEIHGAHHADALQWEEDLARANDIALGGRRVVQLTSWSVRHEPYRVADLLEALLRSAGWTRGS
jgi:very-short-patch-repair endonuclease